MDESWLLIQNQVGKTCAGQVLKMTGLENKGHFKKLKRGHFIRKEKRAL